MVLTARTIGWGGLVVALVGCEPPPREIVTWPLVVAPVGADWGDVQVEGGGWRLQSVRLREEPGTSFPAPEVNGGITTVGEVVGSFSEEVRLELPGEEAEVGVMRGYEVPATVAEITVSDLRVVGRRGGVRLDVIVDGPLTAIVPVEGTGGRLRVGLDGSVIAARAAVGGAGWAAGLLDPDTWTVTWEAL